MAYKEHQPNPLLSSFVETYWTYSGLTGEGKSHKIFPDGCVDIILTLNQEKEIVRSDIVGTMTTFLEVSYMESVQMMGIRFKPAGITAFTRVPVSEFTNRNVKLTLADTVFDHAFYEILPEKKSVNEIISYIDHYLIGKLPYLYHPDKQVIGAVDLIYLSKGQLSLTDVASEVCLCQRHFERKFKLAIGISPKTFAKIVRFKHALHYLQDYPHKDILSVAIECGYYDHTHLIKDFKSLSSDTPAHIRH